MVPRQPSALLPNAAFVQATAPLERTAPQPVRTYGSRSAVSSMSSPQAMDCSKNASSSGVTSASFEPQPAGFERRIAWLEEDMATLQRRLRDESGEGSGSTAASDPSLKMLVSRLEAEFASERRQRQGLDLRLARLEEALNKERQERAEQLQSFSAELEMTMRTLIGRIDESLSAGASAMRERTDQTEMRIRGLIKRVDEGLFAGAAALQDTLNVVMPDSEPALPSTGSAAPADPERSDAPRSTASDKVDQVMQAWHKLRQENSLPRVDRTPLNSTTPSGLQGVHEPDGGPAVRPIAPVRAHTVLLSHPGATPVLRFQGTTAPRNPGRGPSPVRGLSPQSAASPPAAARATNVVPSMSFSSGGR